MIKINDLSLKLTRHKPSIMAALERVVDRGWLVLGPEVAQFEEAFARYLDVAHCVSLANGTDAIELGLKSLGVSPGSLVATAANAGMYTCTALQAIGATPYFLDVDPESSCVGLKEVERAFAHGVKAVVLTHLYGLAAPEVQAISAFCKDKGLALLEDCAQAHGARVDGQCVGSFGDAASFSFYPTKNLGAVGDGGAVVTNDPKRAESLRKLRQYGWREKYHVELPFGVNSRLDEMQAAVLSTLLPALDADNARRREIATQYNAGIRHAKIAVPMHAGPSYVAHLYVIRVKGRESLRSHLLAQGVHTDIHYPLPDYRQEVYAAQGLAIPALKHTEALSQEVLSLPCYPELHDEDVARVIAAVNGWDA